jgi:hypothetical protein
MSNDTTASITQLNERGAKTADCVSIAPMSGSSTPTGRRSSKTCSCQLKNTRRASFTT